MLGRKRFRIAIGAFAALLALTPSVARAGTWLTPVPLNGSTGSNPTVALDSSGTAIAAWQTNPTIPANPQIVQGARHALGPNGFTPLPDFSTDTTSMHNNSMPAVVVNRSGNGLVVWINDLGGGKHQVQLRTIAPDGTVGSVQTVPSAGGIDSYVDPVAAINVNGDAVIAWVHNLGGVEAITRQGLGGSFTDVATPDALGTSSNTTPPAVGIDGAGDAIVAWDTAGGAIQAKRHPAGGTWTSTPDMISTGGHTYSAPALAGNPAGQMVVAFMDSGEISAVSGTVSAGWGASPTVTTLSSIGVSHGPFINVDDSGGAAVGWSTASAVQVSLRPPGSSFPLPAGVQSISVPTVPDNVALGGNGRGDTVVAWYTFDPAVSLTDNFARAAVKPAGSTMFGAPQVVSDLTANVNATPQIALDQNGDAVLVYSAMSGGNPAGVGLDVYDGAGPLLGTPTGPASIAQGSAGSFSVPQPIDAFSPVSSVRWSFGDSTAPAVGQQVMHSFATAGKYTVTVNATDAVGNTSSATLAVTVTPNSSGGGGGGSGGGTKPRVTHCVVPKLKGKTLAQAKTALHKAHCALGQVRAPKPPKHHKLGKLVVVSSSPGAGSVRASGTKVRLALGPAPKPKPRRHGKNK